MRRGDNMKNSPLVMCLTLLTLAHLTVAAHAKERFPGEIAQHLGAPAAPPCGVCHEYGKTGGDTLVTPFAWAMRARGMSGGGSSLTDALDRVRTDAVDSDGDGVTDINELIVGTDPNSAASSPASPGSFVDPQLGCAVGGDERAADARRGRLPGLLIGVLAGGLLVLRRARRGSRAVPANACPPVALRRTSAPRI